MLCCAQFLLQFTVDNYFLIENLEPFTDYMVEIKGCNKYTGRTFVTDSLFGIAVNLKTLEGGMEMISFLTTVHVYYVNG